MFMHRYRLVALKVGGVIRLIFGSVLLVAFFVKLFGIEETFAGGYFGYGVLDTAFKAFLMVEAPYWALRYRVATTSAP